LTYFNKIWHDDASLTHPSPKPKWHLDRFSRFSTAYGRRSLFFTMGRTCPVKNAYVHVGSGGSVTYWLWRWTCNSMVARLIPGLGVVE